MDFNGIVIIGPPGSGKSTVGKEVARKLGMVYVSSGDIARKLAIFDKTTSDNLDRGDMANETLMRSTIHSTLYDINYHNKRFLLDGFPRTGEQLKWILDRFPNLLSYAIDIPASICIDRLMRRNRHDDTLSVILRRMQYFETITRPMVDAITDLIMIHDPDMGTNAIIDVIINDIDTRMV